MCRSTIFRPDRDVKAFPDFTQTSPPFKKVIMSLGNLSPAHQQSIRPRRSLRQCKKHEVVAAASSDPDATQQLSDRTRLTFPNYSHTWIRLACSRGQRIPKCRRRRQRTFSKRRNIHLRLDMVHDLKFYAFDRSGSRILARTRCRHQQHYHGAVLSLAEERDCCTASASCSGQRTGQDVSELVPALSALSHGKQRRMNVGDQQRAGCDAKTSEWHEYPLWLGDLLWGICPQTRSVVGFAHLADGRRRPRVLCRMTDSRCSCCPFHSFGRRRDGIDTLGMGIQVYSTNTLTRVRSAQHRMHASMASAMLGRPAMHLAPNHMHSPLDCRLPRRLPLARYKPLLEPLSTTCIPTSKKS